jgi:putative MATE family efflux protein
LRGATSIKVDDPSPTAADQSPAPDRSHGNVQLRGHRSQYVTRDLTQGSIPRNLWFLAWPQYVEGFLQIVDQIADLFWAGLFGGFRAIAGVGAAQQYILGGFTLRQGIDMAMRAMVSRAIGMGDTALASHVVLQAVMMTAIYSVVLAAIGILFTEPLLRVLGLSDAVIALAAGYMRVQLIGQAAQGFQSLTSNALAAAGDTMTPMKAGITTVIIKLALSPVFIFGVFDLPGLGLEGAALAAVVGNTVSLVYLLVVILRGSSRLRVQLTPFHFDWPLQKRMLRLGWPAAVNRMERTIAQLTFGFLVAPFGDVAYAAFTVTRRMEMLAHQSTTGIGNAAGTIVGQSIGAGQPERARSTVWWAMLFGLMVSGGMALLMAIFPNAFLSLFAREPEFIEAARPWLYICLLGYLALGATAAMGQAFQQAGAPFVVMLVNLASLWAVVPIALVLTKATPLEALGVAWAMVIALLFRPIAFIPYFLSGRWLRIRLFDSEPVLGPGGASRGH